MKKQRQLSDLISVGPRTVEDFRLLGITRVEQLKTQSADKLYEKMCRKLGVRVDPCQHDVFRAAIEQAKHPNLLREKCQWWYWSRVRKETKR